MIISITMNPKPNKLLNRVREIIRLKKYSDKIKQARPLFQRPETLCHWQRLNLLIFSNFLCQTLFDLFRSRCDRQASIRRAA